MNLLLTILIVLSPGILYALALAIFAARQEWFNPRCPKCRKKSLRMVNAINATILTNGQRAPDYWAYYSCTACREPLKRHRDAWEPLTDVERQQYFPPRF